MLRLVENGEDLDIVGFAPATEGWYVLDHVGDGVVHKSPITGWLLTIQQISIPVSPQHPLENMPNTVPMLGPDGHIFNRAGEWWQNIGAFTRHLKES